MSKCSDSMCRDCVHWDGVCPPCSNFQRRIQKSARVRAAIKHGLWLFVEIAEEEAGPLKEAGYRGGDPIWLDISPRGDDDTQR
jgi:hypothetical protein